MTNLHITSGANFALLGWIEIFTGVALIASAVGFQYYATRGLGYKNRPHGPEGPPEENSLSATVAMICGVMYFGKAFDFFEQGNNPNLEPSAFSVNKYWYLDYVVTCPLIVLDFCLTVNLRYKLPFTAATLILLVIATATFLVPFPYKLYYYFLGLIGFGSLFFSLNREINRQAQHVPLVAQALLNRARIILFSFWPLFPLLWIFSFNALELINEEAYIIIHALLDITCKAVFQVVMLQFRLTIEDHDFDELQEEKTRVMGSKELVELAKDTNTKAYLGRTVLPWADDASVGSSQLMSRARRQRMLYEHERGITSSDPAAQKLRELDAIQRRIQSEVDRQSRRVEREISAKFTGEQLARSRSASRGNGLDGPLASTAASAASLGLAPPSMRGARAPQDIEVRVHDVMLARAPTPRSPGGTRSRSHRRVDDQSSEDASGSDEHRRPRGGAGGGGGASAFDESWQPGKGRLFDDAVPKPSTLRHHYKRFQLAHEKLGLYGDEIEHGEMAHADVVTACGYESPAAYDRAAAVFKFALKMKRGNAGIAAVLDDMRTRRFDDLVEACQAAGFRDARVTSRRPSLFGDGADAPDAAIRLPSPAVLAASMD